MFFIYQLIGLIRLAWLTDPAATTVEVTRLADYANKRRSVVAAGMLMQLLRQLAGNKPLGDFGDEDTPLELTSVKFVPDVVSEPLPPRTPETVPRVAKLFRRKAHR